MSTTETVGAGGVTSPEPTPPAQRSVEVGQTSASDASRSRRKVREGIVVSDRMDKTRIVLVQQQKPHALYKKVVRISRRLKVDDATNESHVGDRVRIAETRPISKDKRWRLDSILERAK